ncbi:MAG: hypothetical protein U0223_07550 [Nitrospira sp.]|nr:hypothetical protein [Nitrospira sp.]
MVDQSNVRTLIGEREVDSPEQALNELELSLVTVEDVIDRNADGAPPEDSYIGVNLGLYVQHTKAILMRCRQLLERNAGAAS